MLAGFRQGDVTFENVHKPLCVFPPAAVGLVVNKSAVVWGVVPVAVDPVDVKSFSVPVRHRPCVKLVCAFEFASDAASAVVAEVLMGRAVAPLADGVKDLPDLFIGVCHPASREVMLSMALMTFSRAPLGVRFPLRTSQR